MKLAIGRIEDELPGLDIVADSMARSYPEHFHGQEDTAERRLLDLLIAGNPKAATEDEAYERALDLLARQQWGNGVGLYAESNEGDVAAA